MLTEEEKQRIREEEIFRREVQKTLDSQASNSRLSKIIRFFNTALGLWLLSSIFLGALSLAYTRWEANRAEKQGQLTQTRNIKIELGARRNYSLELLSKPDMSINDYVGAHRDFLEGSRLSNVFTDYKERSTRSLLLELVLRVPESERAMVTEALQSCARIDSLGQPAPYSPFDREDPKRIESFKRELLSASWRFLQ